MPLWYWMSDLVSLRQWFKIIQWNGKELERLCMKITELENLFKSQKLPKESILQSRTKTQNRETNASKFSPWVSLEQWKLKESIEDNGTRQSQASWEISSAQLTLYHDVDFIVGRVIADGVGEFARVQTTVCTRGILDKEGCLLCMSSFKSIRLPCPNHISIQLPANTLQARGICIILAQE